ncbi:MAG: hypothetical protein NZ750_05065 [Anaerolineae bacterium]|nr:hypothetical protein [Anaerolineae bacterium]MDW8173570.1 hypothetical protein [Anaerolineae bacterium]
MEALHNVLFNMQALYSFALGVYAAILAAQNKSISGNFWGAVGTYTVLNVLILILGIILASRGEIVESGGRNTIYFLYMAFLVVIMPGLFSLLRGRDDRNAAIAFSLLALFNASVSISMIQRGLVTWIVPS